MGPEGFGDHDREGAYCGAAPVYENPLACLELAEFEQGLVRGEAGDGEPGRLGGSSVARANDGGRCAHFGVLREATPTRS